MRFSVCTALGLLLCTAVVHAHITLEQSSAASGSTYKGVLRIPHGCDGSATTGITLQLPEGVQRAKPMPKPGWSLTTQTAKLKQPYDYYGDKISEDVSTISWSGGNLPDAQYDEFVFRARLPQKAGQTLYFKVTQQCEKGSTEWAALPGAQGEPAVALKLTEPAAHSH